MGPTDREGIFANSLLANLGRNQFFSSLLKNRQLPRRRLGNLGRGQFSSRLLENLGSTRFRNRLLRNRQLVSSLLTFCE